MSLVSFRSENEEVGRVPGIDRDTGGVSRGGGGGCQVGSHTCWTPVVQTHTPVVPAKFIPHLLSFTLRERKMEAVCCGIVYRFAL